MMQVFLLIFFKDFISLKKSACLGDTSDEVGGAGLARKPNCKNVKVDEKQGRPIDFWGTAYWDLIKEM